jgi:hypothetical protein
LSSYNTTIADSKGITAIGARKAEAKVIDTVNATFKNDKKTGNAIAVTKRRDGELQSDVEFEIYNGTTLVGTSQKTVLGRTSFYGLAAGTTYTLREYTVATDTPYTVLSDSNKVAWTYKDYDSVRAKHYYEYTVRAATGVVQISVVNEYETPPTTSGGRSPDSTTTIPPIKRLSDDKVPLGPDDGPTAVSGTTGSPVEMPDNIFGLSPAIIPDPPFSGDEFKPEDEEHELVDPDLPRGPARLPKTGRIGAAAQQMSSGLSAVLAGLALVLKKRKK